VAAGHGGQVLVSGATALLVGDDLPARSIPASATFGLGAGRRITLW
jgi:hypothetical protein